MTETEELEFLRAEVERYKQLNAKLREEKGASAIRAEWTFSGRITHLIVTDPFGDAKREADVAIRVMAAHSRLLCTIEQSQVTCDELVGVVQLLESVGEATPERLIGALKTYFGGEKSTEEVAP